MVLVLRGNGVGIAGIKADRYSVEKFSKSTRVTARFFNAFAIAYDSIVGTPGCISR